MLACMLFIRVFSQHNDPKIVVPHVNPALRFTENNGQWKDNILLKATLDGGALYVEKNALTFDFYDKEKFRSLHKAGAYRQKYKDLSINCHAYRIYFDGCNLVNSAEKMQAGSDYENFFLGNDRSKWKSFVKNYHQIWLREIYTGIDYEAITAISGLKYNFHVKPGANPTDIKMRYEGASSVKLKSDMLYVELTVNSVREQKPYAYQLIDGTVVEVPCHYTLRKNVVGFEFPQGYNKNYELVIDPVLVFAAQSGSSSDNFGMTATFDAAGNLYAGGTVFNNGYPTTLGAYSNVFHGTPQSGNTDVVITKYNSVGNALLYSTYIGGTSTEIVTSMIVDYNNNLCFYGATGSANFPMDINAYDPSFNGGVPLQFIYNGTSFPGGTDIYLGKLNSSGSTLMASTYLGGSDNDGVNHVNHQTYISPVILEYATDSLQFNYGDQYRGEIQVDVLNNIYIASSTRSSNFPTVNAYDNTLGGKQDAIIAKFDPNLSQLLYSTYLGGSSNESGNSLIVTTGLEVYATGGTCSPNFPVTAGASQISYAGGKSDAYIVHLSAAGNQLLHSTFVGTNDYDQSYFVQSDKYDRIYVYGQSLGNMPVINTATPALPYHNTGTHQFIQRFNKTLGAMNLSTVFGSSTTHMDVSPCAFSVDKCNNIYLSGWGGDLINQTYATVNMPLFQATQASTDGFDFYFMGLDSSASALKYGSYFGGNQSAEHVDGGTSRFDPRGKIYQSACAGCGGNDDFPVTPGSWPNTPGDPNHSLNCNNGVVKLDFQLQLSIATINTASLGVCANTPVTFTSANQPSNPGATTKWFLNNALVSTSGYTTAFTFTAPGNYTVSLVVNDNLTCNIKDSTISYVTVFARPTAVISSTYAQCSTTVALSNTVTGSAATSSISWNFGDSSPLSTQNNPLHTYANSGTYIVSFTANDAHGCSDLKTLTVTVFDFKPSVAPGATICYGKSVNLNAGGGTTYTWLPGTGLNNNQTSSPIASPSVSTVYTVNIDNNTPGYKCSQSYTTEVQVNPTPTTGFSFTMNPCGGGCYFADASKDDVVAWNWTFASAVSSTIQNPYYFYAQGGTYTISLVSTNSYGCKSAKDSIIVIPTPEPVTVNGGGIICKGDRIQLNANGGIEYAWSPSLTLDYPGISSPYASPTVSTEYTVKITTQKSMNGKNCEYDLVATVNVMVLSSVPVSAKADPVMIVTGNTSTLTYKGDVGANVKWYPIGSTQPPTGYTVTAKPDRPTTYTVIANRGPCTETVLVHVDAYSEGCLQQDVFIPNTFTPNGDGDNDLLFVRSYKVDELFFAVYNRWGEAVFETNDKSKGWDGLYKGKLAEAGVYGWYLKAHCANGSDAFMKGNVTLVR